VIDPEARIDLPSPGEFAASQLRDLDLTPDEHRVAWFVLRDVAEQAGTHLANVEQDRIDEALDAQRVHGGQTLDEFMAGE
jgi:hypothetical protein